MANASRFVNKNLSEALDHYSAYDIHKKKLQSIKQDLELKKQGKKAIVDDKEELFKMRIIANKLKDHEFKDNEMISSIQKQNQKLMVKLYEISQRKSTINSSHSQSIMGNAAGVGQSSIMTSQNFAGATIQNPATDQQMLNNQTLQSVKSRASQLGALGQGPIQNAKSLNMPFRKKEAYRIDEENQKLIERIMNTNPSLQMKQLQADYADHQKFKRNIMRSKPLPIEQMIKKKKELGDGLESKIMDGLSKEERHKIMAQRESLQSKPKLSPTRSNISKSPVMMQGGGGVPNKLHQGGAEQSNAASSHNKSQSLQQNSNNSKSVISNKSKTDSKQQQQIGSSRQSASKSVTASTNHKTADPPKKLSKTPQNKLDSKRGSAPAHNNNKVPERPKGAERAPVSDDQMHQTEKTEHGRMHQSLRITEEEQSKPLKAVSVRGDSKNTTIKHQQSLNVRESSQSNQSKAGVQQVKKDNSDIEELYSEDNYEEDNQFEEEEEAGGGGSVESSLKAMEKFKFSDFNKINKVVQEESREEESVMEDEHPSPQVQQNNTKGGQGDQEERGEIVQQQNNSDGGEDEIQEEEYEEDFE